MLRRISFIIGLGLCAQLALGDYPDAEGVLERIAQAPAAPDAAEIDEQDESAQFERRLETFAESWDEMTAEEAAAEWLALVDAHGELPQPGWEARHGGGGSYVEFERVLAALPGPSTWDALAEAIDRREEAEGVDGVREAGLGLLAAMLQGDLEAQREAVAGLEQAVGTLRRMEAQQYVYVLERLADVMSEGWDEPQDRIAQLESQLEALGRGRGESHISMPDLVTLAGEEKAEALLRQALSAPGVKVSVRVGDRTQALARRVALEMIDELDVPQWSLAESVDAVELYEALEERFVEAKEPERRGGIWSRMFGDGGHYDDYDPHEYERRNARTYYLLGLIAKGRTAEAAAVARDIGEDGWVYLPHEAMSALDRAGHTAALYGFFRDLLEVNPELPFWDEFISLSARTNETAEMLALLREMIEREDMPADQRLRVKNYLYRALLAADEVEEGIELMRAELAEPARRGDPEQMSRRVSMAVQLAELGILLEREELVTPSVETAREELSVLARSGEHDWEIRGHTTQLADLLFRLDRGPEAAEVLIDALAQRTRPARQRHYYYGGTPGQQEAIELLGLYHRAGLHEDVLELLETLPHFGASDLVEIYTNRDGQGTPVGQMAAAALADQGRTAEARRIVDAVLDGHRGYDPAYKLLIEIAGEQEVIARLDELFSRDQFEERPLIWKAEVLRRAGELDEAEKVALQAVAIDPSDGEQGPGRRMRVYAVLGDIHADRGETAEAEFFREVMRAIRLAEEADAVYAAGLLHRGVEMYRQALTHFSDAYCIQSRLAIQLAEMGRHEEAEVHYRRAYELMPDSFGRVESHCFGCEGAFAGARAQSIAEQVFTEMLEERPEQPQLHYLIGYLRQSQGRHAEALAAFQEAVRLDPQYLSAWKQIESVGRRLELPAKERDAVTFAMLRLDPLQRHSRPSLESVSDLRGLWSAVEEAAAWRAEPPEALYPLPASARALEARQIEEDDPWMHYSYSSSWCDGSLSSPGEAIARHNVVSMIGQLVEMQEWGW